MAVESLRVMGRATQGVRLIKVNENDSISSVEKVEKIDEIEEEENVEESPENSSGEDKTES